MAASINILCLITLTLIGLCHLSAGRINPEWCSRQCTCFNNYRKVDCSRRHLLSMPSISNLTINLYMDINDIRTLPTETFDSLPNLMMLSMEWNSLETISSDHFCGLKNLRILNLGHNKLKSFVIPRNVTEECQLPALKQLLLDSNHLSEIPENLAEWAPGLETLNISFNALQTVALNSSFSQLTSLRALDLRGNQIHTISADDFAPLKDIPLNSLSLSECGIAHIDPEAFRGMTELVSISLSRNLIGMKALGDIFTAIGNTSQMVQLDLCEMFLPNLTVNLLGMFKHLTILDVFESSVKYIEPELFNTLSDLETLRLGHNNLEQIPNLKAAKRLRWLSLEWNKLTDINLRDLDNLETIDLSGNKLVTIPLSWLGTKYNLQFLNVSYNHITSVHSQAFHGISLQMMDLSHNELTRAQAMGITQLRKLILSHNALSSVSSDTFHGLKDTLQFLDLSYNNISSLPHDLDNFNSLQELHLGHNHLGTALKEGRLRGLFHYMGLLQNLELRDNGITEVAPHQWESLHHLTTLDLSNNDIQSLASVSFNEFPSLAVLVLANNRLRVIDITSLHELEYLEEVDFSGNPFDCSPCSVLPFQHWINATMVVILNNKDASEYMCFTPPDLQGIYLYDFHPQPIDLCMEGEAPIRTQADWAMIGIAIAGVVVFLMLVIMLFFYSQICHKIKSLHYRWQVRYREVSGVEFKSDAKVLVT